MKLPHYLAIVRRGDTRTFRELEDHAALCPYPVTVIWDRRGGDTGTTTQAVASERRHPERRVREDPLWHAQGFTIVEAGYVEIDPLADSQATDTGAAQQSPRRTEA